MYLRLLSEFIYSCSVNLIFDTTLEHPKCTVVPTKICALEWRKLSSHSFHSDLQDDDRKSKNASNLEQ